MRRFASRPWWDTIVLFKFSNHDLLRTPQHLQSNDVLDILPKNLIQLVTVTNYHTIITK